MWYEGSTMSCTESNAAQKQDENCLPGKTQDVPRTGWGQL